MSKTWNSLGMAVLVAALLMGTASADATAQATVEGCLLTTDYLELDSSLLTATVDLGLLPASNQDGGDLQVLAEKAWKITVKDDNNLGTMKTGTSTYLTNPLTVITTPLGTTEGVQIATGSATSDCEYDVVDIDYDQTLQAGDTTVGAYTISITYTLANA